MTAGGHAAVVIVDDARPTADIRALPVDLHAAETLAVACLAAEDAVGELALTFVDRAAIADLNEEHMGKDGPTDVLSFPLDAADDLDNDAGVVDGVPRLLGDVVISPAIAAEQAPGHAGSFADEIALLVVHGVLHIVGHDHAEPAEAAVMRERELDLLRRHHWRGNPPEGFRQTHVDP